MEHKIVLAVDGSLHAKRAVKYGIRLHSQVENLSYILLTIQPDVSQFLEEEAKTNLKARSAVEQLKKKQAETAKAVLETYQGLMMDAGIHRDWIQLVNRPKHQGIAKDILDFSEKKQVDAIVVGRRGLSKMEGIFMGSLTVNLLEHSRILPVWVIDGDIASDNVLIAVDGSESAYRAVDHLSFIFTGNEALRITFFHVIPRIGDFCSVDFDAKESELEELIITGQQRKVENFFGQAKRRLSQAGIGEDQITVKQVKRPLNVGKAIVREAMEGDYGTVVIGRSGVSKAFFMGSVSKYVLNHVQDRAIWLVP